jgi:GNAT superfamily N-acetyltransferase
MLIRKLDSYAEYSKAVDLRIRCWDEELAGYAPNRLTPEKELDFLVEWEQSAEDYDDVRHIYGLFLEGNFSGFAGGSFAEPSDSENGFELNYLFVEKGHRGKGYSLMLLDKLLEDFISEGKKEMIVYSLRHAPSNNFYRKYGGKPIREVHQGQDNLLVDVFKFNATQLQSQIRKSLKAKKTHDKNS